jgi:hypothetical protein
MNTHPIKIPASEEAGYRFSMRDVTGAQGGFL